MVLIISSPKGKYKDGGVYESVLNYCMNPEKNPVFFSPNLDQGSAATDMKNWTEKTGKLRGTRIRHMILSLSGYDAQPNTKAARAAILYQIAKDACTFYQSDYQIFFVIHQGKSTAPHAHVIFNTVSLTTGMKYPGDKKDYYAFQKHLREIARNYPGVSFNGAYYNLDLDDFLEL